MEKNILLLCNGLSGSGKTTFINKFLNDAVYNLKSMTTRNMRDGETWGDKYYFVDEDVFNIEPKATTLFVNEAFWKPGDAKWLYGVPEFEVEHNLGQHLVYDVIQPRYSRQLIDWFNKNGLNKYYDYKVLWFLPPSNSTDIVKERANMAHDADVRRTNTCDAIDFLRVGLQPDYILKSSAEETIIPRNLHGLIDFIRHNTIYNGELHARYAQRCERPLEKFASMQRCREQTGADCKRKVQELYLGR